MSSSLWMNRGQITEQSSLSDRGFRFGWRVMTTMLAKGDVVIDFERHMERLEAHAEVFGLANGFRVEVIRFELQSLLQSLGAKHAACRVYITADGGGLRDKIGRPDRWLHVESYEPETANPLKLHLAIEASWQRGSRVKTGLYPFALPTVPRAREQGFDDVLWCNSDHEIAEATSANIFLIGRDGDLVEIATPPESSGILAGVTRRRVIELLMSARIPVTERIIYRDELPRFDEAFVTSSLAGPRPVAQIANHRLQTMRPNAVYGHIQRLWNTWLTIL